jgi:hypothetical protein
MCIGRLDAHKVALTLHFQMPLTRPDDFLTKDRTLLRTCQYAKASPFTRRNPTQQTA